MRNMVKDEGGWTTEQIWGSHGVSRWKGIYGGLVSFSKFLRFEKRDGSRVRFWTKFGVVTALLRTCSQTCLR
jgi:hypothetical protein